MYCESAKRECLYLDDIRVMHESCVVRRAIQETQFSSGAEMEEWFAQMEVTSKSWLNSIAENDCDESTCASLRVASTNALINEVNTHLIIEKLITNGEEE